MFKCHVNFERIFQKISKYFVDHRVTLHLLLTNNRTSKMLLVRCGRCIVIQHLHMHLGKINKGNVWRVFLENISRRTSFFHALQNNVIEKKRYLSRYVIRVRSLIFQNCKKSVFYLKDNPSKVITTSIKTFCSCYFV